MSACARLVSTVCLLACWQQVTLYGSRMWNRSYPRGHEVALDGCERKAVVHYGGLYIPGSDGGAVSVKQLQFESGKMIEASKYGQEEEEIELHLTPEEEAFSKEIKVTELSQFSNKRLILTYCVFPCQPLLNQTIT